MLFRVSMMLVSLSWRYNAETNLEKTIGLSGLHNIVTELQIVFSWVCQVVPGAPLITGLKVVTAVILGSGSKNKFILNR